LVGWSYPFNHPTKQHKQRTIETTLYKFNELTDDAKETAIDNLRFVNVEHGDWWNSTFEDAKEIGLKITSFDLDRRRGADGEFIDSAEHCASLIIKNHGEMCETYKTAQSYLSDRNGLVSQYSDGENTSVVTEENEYDFDKECDELDAEFLKSILEDYSIILQNESEYLTSDEAVQDTIEANDYEFTEDGELS